MCKFNVFTIEAFDHIWKNLLQFFQQYLLPSDVTNVFSFKRCLRTASIDLFFPFYMSILNELFNS